jgi:hypothetical protein
MLIPDAEQAVVYQRPAILFSLAKVKSMTSNVKLLDVVALTSDLPQYDLWRGQVGTVVETLANGTAFEVEFSDRDGRTYESLGLRADQIMVLHFEPKTPEMQLEAVAM